MIDGGMKSLTELAAENAMRPVALKTSSPSLLAGTQKSPGHFTVTEALNSIHGQQDAIKAALDQLISDAMTLRAQL